MDHTDVIDLIPAYALDCLEPGEKREVDLHLASCPECQVELRAYLETVSVLAYAAPQVKPPARLRGAVLHRVRPDQVKPGFWAGLQGWWRGLSPAWGLAGFALVLVLAASNILLWRQVQSLATPPAAASELQVVKLSGTANQPEANGLMVITQEGGAGTLTVDGLKLLPVEKQYQLWLIKDGKRTNGGVFSVDEKGYAAIVVHAPLPLIKYSAFGITIEPAGGSPGPTGEKVMGTKT